MTEFNSDQAGRVLTRDSRVASRQIRDERVLLDVSTSRYYSVNDTGSRAWELMDGQRTLEQIARQMAGEYGVEITVILSDLTPFIRDLEAEELVHVSAPSLPVS